VKQTKVHSCLLNDVAGEFIQGNLRTRCSEAAQLLNVGKIGDPLIHDGA
jgi:hypothetical protein